MNDDDLITLVRAQRDKVPLTTPVEEIISRGRALRTRRLVTGVTGVSAVAIGVTLSVSALTPASHQTSPQAGDHAHQTSDQTHHADNPPTVQVAAWTITKLADGTISVTIRQLHDPAGLQSTLRADGVPASVTFEQLNSACKPYPSGTPGSPSRPGPTALLTRVFPTPYQDLPAPPQRTNERLTAGASPTPGSSATNPDATVIVIDPSALPSNAGVQLASASRALLLPQLVYAGPQCTGS